MAVAVGQFTIIDFNDINISPTAPSNPVVNQLWLDSSVVPNQLKRWDGSSWVVVNDTSELEDVVDDKVDKDYVIDAINLSAETIKIDGKKINITANTEYSTKVSQLETNISTATQTANNAKDALDDVQADMDLLAGEIGDVSGAITDLDEYVDGTFKDGVISQAEAKAIEKYLNVVNTEKADIDAKYTKLYANTLLTGTAKTDLLAKKNLYNTAHTNLISAINTAISDGKATPTEKTNVDSKFTAYKTALTNLSTAFETASAHLVSVVNGKIENTGGILTRLTSAESKITPEAIETTVSARTDLNGDPLFAKTSKVKQTIDEWTATFSQIGGTNLIKESHMLSDKFEIYQGSTLTTLKDGVAVPEWGAESATQVRSSSAGTSDLKARWVISQDMTFMAGKDMVFSVYAKNNRPDVAVTIGTNRIGEPVTLAGGESRKIDFIGVPVGNDGKFLILELRAPTSGYYLDVTLWHPQWELGNIITEWSPHPDELYTGITSIDKDGINVGISTSDINTQISHQGLTIKDGTKEVAGFIEGGAWIGSLDADNIRGDVVNTHSGGIINIGSAYEYTSISEALKDIGNGKHLLSDLTFRVYNQLNEDITIRGFTGGMVYIAIMAGGSIYGNILYYQNASSGYVYGYGGQRQLLRGTIRVSGSHVFIKDLNIDPNDTSMTAVVTEYGGSAFVMSCDITRCRFGVLAQNGGIVTALNNIGYVAGSNAIYNTYNGGVLYARGTMPQGTVKFGGTTTAFWYDHTTSQQPSQFQPPAVSPTLMTQTFSPTKIETYSHQYGGISSSYPNRAAQNRWDSGTGYFEGRITFGGEVRNYINDRNGDTGLKVEMRLRRYSGANGQWSPVAVDKQFSTIGTFSAIDRGNWGNWVQISSSLITTSGYTFKFGSQSTGSSYAVWDAAQVRVTKTKNI